MLLKKLIFLTLPLIFVYWRSRTAQQAVNWLFRGVIPQDGAFGKVLHELRQDPAGSGSANETRRKQRPASLAARLANNWRIFLAFVAGVAITAILFSRFGHHE